MDFTQKKLTLFPILSVFFIYFSGKLLSILLTSASIDPTFLVILYRSLSSLILFFYFGGNKQWLTLKLAPHIHAWKFMFPLLIVNLILGWMSFGAQAASVTNETIESGLFIINFFYILILCFFIGINEEMMFRGLMLGGFMNALKKKKNGLMLAAILSSLLFGFFHVMTDIDFTQPLTWIQGAMKTIQTGMFGFMLCALVLEDKNLTGASCVHSFSDWLILGSYIFTGLSSNVAHYISLDSHLALYSILFYGFIILLYAPRTNKAYRKIKALEGKADCPIQ